MNYAQSQQDAMKMRAQLLKRRQEIDVQKELLDKENGEIERQLIGLERVLEGLEFLSSDIPPEIEQAGFTEQIRKMLMRTRAPLTAIEIRDALLAAGVKHKSAKTLLISVHTVLGRLRPDLKESEKDGKAAFIWKVRVRRRRVFPSSLSHPAIGVASLTSLYGFTPPAGVVGAPSLLKPAPPNERK